MKTKIFILLFLLVFFPLTTGKLFAQSIGKNIHYYMLDKGNKKELPAGNYFSDNEKIAVVNGAFVTAISNGDCMIYSVSGEEKKEFAHITVGWPSQNPILPYTWRMYIADSESHNFNGKIYIYGSLDASDTYCSPNYMSLATPDLKHWESNGYSLSSLDKTVEMPYPGRILWDCDGHFYDGKYYLYGFFEWIQGNENYSFVMESDNPMGPFKNFRWVTGNKSEKPVDAISSQILTDNDGQCYITYAPTMNAVEDNYAVIARLTDVNVINENSVTNIGPYLKDFYEGPSLRRRGDTYYFIYVENCGRITKTNRRPYRLSYATSKNIFGPYTYRGNIITVENLQGNSNIQGSIEKFGDNWYVFYHRAFNGEWNRRTLCVEKIEFDSEGLIIPVSPTSSGIAENGLDTSYPIWLNTAVFGENYKFNNTGEYGRILITSNAEIGFRYINFTGKEKTLNLEGENLDNIAYIKISTGGKTVGERRGNGSIMLKNVPKGKSELLLTIITLNDIQLEKMIFK